MAPRLRRDLPQGRGRRSLLVAFWLGLALAALGLIGRPNRAAAETIEQALARAYANNPQLNAQRAIVRQTDEGVPQALSGYRPTVSANASVGRQYSDVKDTIPPTPPFLTNGASFETKGLTTPRAVGATVSQTLFNGQQTANKVRAAESQVSAARETLRVMEQSVLLAAATVYMDVSRDSANLEVQRNNVRVLERTLTDTQNRFSAGQVTQTDVAQSEAQLAAAQAASAAAEATLATKGPTIGALSASIPTTSRRRRRSSGLRRRRSPPRSPLAPPRIQTSARRSTAWMSRSCK